MARVDPAKKKPVDTDTVFQDLLARVARGQLAPFRSKATIQARAALPRLTEDRGDLNERQRK